MKKVDSNPIKKPWKKRLNVFVKKMPNSNLRKQPKRLSLRRQGRNLKKDVKTVTVTEEQMKLLSTLFPDIDTLF